MGQKKHVSGRRELSVSTLGELLLSRRVAEGLSLTQMAVKLGISRPYLSRLERGKQAHPSPAILARLGKRLQVPSEDLYALAGCLPPTDLPSFVPYLRAKHPDWPDLIITELDDFRDFLQHKHSLR